VWERQALTKARTIAGDAATAARLRAAISHVAFPDRWDAAWGDELRHIKARIEKERRARGSAGGTVYDVKLGSGCLNDIEFCAQWLALKYGHAHPALQTPNTLRQIEAASQAELLSETRAAGLVRAYIFLRRAELRLQVTQEHSIQAVKRDSTEWTAWARSLYPATPDAPEHFAMQWQTHTQTAREIMEMVRDAL
jgi:glutamate-ammonia-ligase adenylyltransferase